MLNELALHDEIDGPEYYIYGNSLESALFKQHVNYKHPEFKVPLMNLYAGLRNLSNDSNIFSANIDKSEVFNESLLQSNKGHTYNFLEESLRAFIGVDISSKFEKDIYNLINNSRQAVKSKYDFIEK